MKCSSQVRSLIAQSKIKESIDVLETCANQRNDKDFINLTTLLLGRYSEFKRKKLRGVATFEELNVEINTLRDNIIEAVPEKDCEKDCIKKIKASIYQEKTVHDSPEKEFSNSTQVIQIPLKKKSKKPSEILDLIDHEKFSKVFTRLNDKLSIQPIHWQNKLKLLKTRFDRLDEANTRKVDNPEIFHSRWNAFKTDLKNLVLEKDQRLEIQQRSNFKVLVLPFFQQNEGIFKSKYSEKIVDEIQKIEAYNSLKVSIDIQKYDIEKLKEVSEAFGFNKAEEIGLSENAQIVVWGKNKRENGKDFLDINYLSLIDFHPLFVPGKVRTTDTLIAENQWKQSEIIQDIKLLVKWNIGYKCYLNHDYRNSLKYLEQITDIPDDKNYLLNRIIGDSYYKLGSFQKAIVIYSKIVKANPLESGVLNNRGLVYTIVGDIEKALLDFNKAIELNPIHPLSYLNRGILWHESFTQEYPEDKAEYFRKAKEDYEQSLKYSLLEEKSGPLNGLGMLSMDQNQLEEALSYFNRSITISPNNHLGYYKRGSIFLERSDAANALDDFLIAASKKTSNQQYLKDVVMTLLKVGKMDDAENIFNGLLQLSPKDKPKLHAFFGGLFAEEGFFEEALKQLDIATRLDPESLNAWQNKTYVYQQLGKNMELISSFERLISLSRQKNPENLLDLHQQIVGPLLEQKYYDKAEYHLKAIHNLEPENVFAWRNKAYLYQKTNQSLKMAESLEKLLSTIDDNEEKINVLHQIADVYLQENDFQNALQFLEGIHKIDPKHISAWKNKAYIYQQTKEDLKLIRALLQTRELEPSERESTTKNIAQIYLQRKDYQTALKYYLELSEQDGFQILKSVAYIYQELGDQRSLKATLIKIMTFEKEDLSQYRNQLLSIYLAENDLENGFSLLNEIIKAEPKNVNAYLRRAYIFSQKEESEKAREDYLKVTKLDEKNANAFYNLGVIFWNSGNHTQGLDYLKKAVELEPGNAQYLDTLRQVQQN